MRLSLKALYPAALLVGIVSSACSKSESDSKEEEPAPDESISSGGATEETTVTMTGTLAITGTSLTAVDNTIYCVSFESTPRAGTSALASDGAFSVEMPKSVNFGCFITETVSKKNIGTFVVGGEGGSLGSGNTSSFALEASVDLGALTLGNNGLVVIPAAALAAAAYVPTSTGIEIDEVHNSPYTMQCIDSGDADKMASCKEMLLEGGESSSVFFRVVKAEGTDGKSLTGFGAWASQAAFAACGSFDINQEMTSRDGVDITLSQGSVGEWTGASCAERDPGPGKTRENLKDYYMISELVKTGGGYSVRDEQEVDQGGGCTTYHSTSIEFSGTSAELIGAFSVMHTRNGCPDPEGAFNESFLVKFTKN